MSFRNHVNFQIHVFTQREKCNSLITQDSHFTISRKEKTHFTISHTEEMPCTLSQKPVAPSPHPPLNEYLVIQKKNGAIAISNIFMKIENKQSGF